MNLYALYVFTFLYIGNHTTVPIIKSESSITSTTTKRSNSKTSKKSLKWVSTEEGSANET